MKKPQQDLNHYTQLSLLHPKKAADWALSNHAAPGVMDLLLTLLHKGTLPTRPLLSLMPNLDIYKLLPVYYFNTEALFTILGKLEGNGEFMRLVVKDLIQSVNHNRNYKKVFEWTLHVLQVLLLNGFDELVRIVFKNHMDLAKIKSNVNAGWKSYASLPLLYEIISQDFDFFFSVLCKHDTSSIPGLINAGTGETRVDLTWILKNTEAGVVAKCVVLLVDIDFEQVDENLDLITQILYPKHLFLDENLASSLFAIYKKGRIVDRLLKTVLACQVISGTDYSHISNAMIPSQIQTLLSLLVSTELNLLSALLIQGVCTQFERFTNSALILEFNASIQTLHTSRIASIIKGRGECEVELRVFRSLIRTSRAFWTWVCENDPEFWEGLLSIDDPVAIEVLLIHVSIIMGRKSQKKGEKECRNLVDKIVEKMFAERACGDDALVFDYLPMLAGFLKASRMEDIVERVVCGGTWVLESAVFYEVKGVRDAVVGVFVKCVAEVLGKLNKVVSKADGDSLSDHVSAVLYLIAGGDDQTMGADPKPPTRQVSIKEKRGLPLWTRLMNMVSFMDRLPLCYFESNERQAVMETLGIMELCLAAVIPTDMLSDLVRRTRVVYTRFARDRRDCLLWKKKAEGAAEYLEWVISDARGRTGDDLRVSRDLVGIYTTRLVGVEGGVEGLVARLDVVRDMHVLPSVVRGMGKGGVVADGFVRGVIGTCLEALKRGLREDLLGLLKIAVGYMHARDSDDGVDEEVAVFLAGVLAAGSGTHTALVIDVFAGLGYSARISSQGVSRLVARIFALVGEDEEALRHLTVSFVEILKRCGGDGFEGVSREFQAALGKAGDMPVWYARAMIRFSEAILETKNENVESRMVKKLLPFVLSKLGGLVLVSRSVGLAFDTLELLTKCFSNKYQRIKSEELGLALSIISIIGSNSFADIQCSADESRMLFTGVCTVLSVMLRNWKQSLVQTAPALIIILKGLLHAFRAPSNAYTASRMRKYGGDEGDVGSGLVHHDNIRLNDPFPVFTRYAPLGDKAVDALSSVLRAFSQKSGLNTGTDSNVDFGLSVSETTLKPYSKHLIFVVAEYIAIQTSSRPVLPGVEQDGIVDGMYHVLDLCGGDKEREFLLAVLGRGDGRGGISGGLGGVGRRAEGGGVRGAGRSLLKVIWEGYGKYHKFSG